MSLIYSYTLNSVIATSNK
ncbi:hypothetical protein JL09_g5916 [Pichia kudriavzevii]|uniref:Uncharacterized protein n=1 Tax=Pichia kudriavzevii TaxID=4909 RepID=A0A099NQZ1_PICKU|nr:hypothetical protein JL09_g5916 [Pichia kudriavzevii]